MARMIPPGYTYKTPAGEKDLFNKLKQDPDAEGWVVLHSLDIKKHQSKIEGELDMVVLAPKLGVLCVEVKGCDVSRHEGKWIYPYETSVEGPFKQVSKAMHSLRKYLATRDSSLSDLLFFSAVVFTRVNFEELSPEWHPWQYINQRLFMRRPISSSMTEILERAHAHVKSRTSRNAWYDDIRSRPTELQVRRIVSLLRDNFEYCVSDRNDIEQLEDNILHFTEEQFDALDILQGNRRVIFKGPAGTGKTFLAIEAARRAILNGESVLFLSYNKLLGDWLKARTSGFARDSDVYKCGTFHSVLLELTGETPVQAAGNAYWQEQLPLLAADRLLDETRRSPVFDFLVIDEAQDLISPEYLDVLDLLVTGGLAGGKWAFFGDFEQQAIYLSDIAVGAIRSLEGLDARAPNNVKYPLRINCRNAAPIAEILTITSGMAPGYKRVLHEREGADVDPVFYASPVDQVVKLTETVHELRKTFKAGEIVILSMRSDDASCVGSLSGGIADIKLAPIRKVNDSNTIPFASIHSFKGLEAAAVIITDIESLNDDRARALLYVGMSRARIRLYMLMHSSCRSSYDRILDSGLKKSSRK